MDTVEYYVYVGHNDKAQKCTLYGNSYFVIYRLYEQDAIILGTFSKATEEQIQEGVPFAVVLEETRETLGKMGF